ncbi:MAG: hypothetical protein LBO73_02410 [Holosporaceae bacterium]|jgi:pyruvate kinase|nr:hypothetical protein [Holosporaceae bacterium]
MIQPKNRNVKIAVTIEPSSHILEDAGELFSAGADIFRVNFFRNSRADNLKIYEAIRAVGRKHRAFPTILADLQWSGAGSEERNSLNLAVELGFDGVILSPIRDPEAVLKAKNTVKGRTAIMAKPDFSEAGVAPEPIIEASDGLATESGAFSLISAEEATDICNRLGRPAIVSVGNFANFSAKVGEAVYRKADAIALPPELSDGRRPLGELKMLNEILENIESDPLALKHIRETARLPHNSTADAICASAAEAVKVSCARVMVLFTDSWNTVLRCSRLRPGVKIILITDSFELAGKSGLSYAVRAIVSKNSFKAEEICKTAKVIVAENRFAAVGDNIVILSNVSADNFVSVCRL